MFYYEIKRMGTWSPEKADRKPTGKTTGGTAYEFRNVQELTEITRNWPLAVLFEHFNPRGSEDQLTAPDGIA